MVYLGSHSQTAILTGSRGQSWVTHKVQRQVKDAGAMLIRPFSGVLSHIHDAAMYLTLHADLQICPVYIYQLSCVHVVHAASQGRAV